MSKRKAKSSTYRKPTYSKTKDPKWSKEKKIFMIIIGILCSALALMAIAGIIIKYYRLISK